MTDVIKEYPMVTDGVQAKGSIVMRHLSHNSLHPFVVHFYNAQDGGYYHGDYCKTLDEAIETFEVKCKRYDPTGTLNTTAVHNEAIAARS